MSRRASPRRRGLSPLRRALIENYAELSERFRTVGSAERFAEHRQMVGSGDFVVSAQEVWRGLYRVGDPREAAWRFVSTRYAGEVIVRADDTIERFTATARPAGTPTP